MDYRRVHQKGGSYFFTVVTHDRKPLLTAHITRLRHAFRTVRDRYPYNLDAIVVLPDHLHCVWRLPPGDADFSGRWMRIKRLFSTGIGASSATPSQVLKREKGIWQRRFWEHCIRDEEDWRRHIDYIHFNPVRHGHALSPAEWPYSSFHRAVAKGWYVADWGNSGVVAGLDGMELE